MVREREKEIGNMLFSNTVQFVMSGTLRNAESPSMLRRVTFFF